MTKDAKWPFEDSGAMLKTYPCDRGTGTPIDYHYFQANANGIVCCRYCGVRPTKP